MNFDFSEEQKLLRTTARDYLEDHAPLGLARSVLESDATMSRELWEGAAEMGWLGAAIPEAWGGAGFGPGELVLIAEELGRALAPIPFVTSATVAEAILVAGTDAQKERYLPGFANGSRIGTLALAEARGVVRPGNVRARLGADGALDGTKIGAPDGASANLALVLARGDSGRPVLALADLEGVARTVDESLDPSRPSAGFAFDAAPAEPLAGRDEDGGTGTAGASSAGSSTGARSSRPSSSSAPPSARSTSPASRSSTGTPSAAPSAPSRPSSTAWRTSTRRSRSRDRTAGSRPGRSPTTTPGSPSPRAPPG